MMLVKDILKLKVPRSSASGRMPCCRSGRADGRARHRSLLVMEKGKMVGLLTFREVLAGREPP